MPTPIKEWTHGVEVEDEARVQLEATASLPIVWPHLAVMPDVHWGMGSTVGSVVPTRGAIIPALEPRRRRRPSERPRRRQEVFGAHVVPLRVGERASGPLARSHRARRLQSAAACESPERSEQGHLRDQAHRRLGGPARRAGCVSDPGPGLQGRTALPDPRSSPVPYGWRQHLFVYAAKPEAVLGFTGSTAGFDREDVAEILALDEGENDGAAWIGLFRLSDGRFAFLKAWCDYTGWGCQEGGESTVGASAADVIKLGMDQEDRKRFGERLAPYEQTS